MSPVHTRKRNYSVRFCSTTAPKTEKRLSMRLKSATVRTLSVFLPIVLYDRLTNRKSRRRKILNRKQKRALQSPLKNKHKSRKGHTDKQKHIYCHRAVYVFYFIQYIYTPQAVCALCPWAAGCACRGGTGRALFIVTYKICQNPKRKYLITHKMII